MEIKIHLDVQDASYEAQMEIVHELLEEVETQLKHGKDSGRLYDDESSIWFESQR